MKRKENNSTLGLKVTIAIQSLCKDTWLIGVYELQVDASSAEMASQLSQLRAITKADLAVSEQSGEAGWRGSQCPARVADAGDGDVDPKEAMAMQCDQIRW